MISINYTTNPKRFRKILGIAGALLTLAFPFYVMLQSSNRAIETEQSLCPFKLLTGFPCPGCGITKSLIFLYKGDLEKSIYFHLFGPLTFLFCLAAILTLSVELFTEKDYFQKILYSKKIAYSLGILLGIYHLSRLVYFISTNNIDDILRQSMWK